MGQQQQQQQQQQWGRGSQQQHHQQQQQHLAAQQQQTWTQEPYMGSQQQAGAGFPKYGAHSGGSQWTSGVPNSNTSGSVAYHWRLRQLQAEHKLRVKVKDAYPVEQWLPSALPHLNSPMKELPALPAGNL